MSGPGHDLSRELSIVIPNWNGRALLERFLPSVLAAVPGAEVVVSDDGSSDDSAEWLAACCPEVRVVRSAVNRGFAVAANAGVEAATRRLVLLLNSDVELRPEGLGELAAWFEDPNLFGVTLRAYDLPARVFATGGKLGRFRRGHWEVWRNFEEPAAARPESFYLGGGFCLFRREAFLILGGFDPIFSPYYSEDVDLSYRARKRGWRLAYAPGTMLYHQQSSSVGRHRGRFRRQVVIERNRLLFHWRNLDRGNLVRHLGWAHLLLLQNVLKGNFAYHAGYGQALGRVREVMRFRRAERAHWRRRDAELAIELGQRTRPS